MIVHKTPVFLIYGFQVQVLPPLRLLRPSNGHFLLPHNGEARIVTNRDGISRLSYQLLQGSSLERQDLISVSPQGEIRTAAVNGHAVVMVTEHEEDLGLNQTVLVHVEVSECVVHAVKRWWLFFYTTLIFILILAIFMQSFVVK